MNFLEILHVFGKYKLKDLIIDKEFFCIVQFLHENISYTGIGITKVLTMLFTMKYKKVSYERLLIIIRQITIEIESCWSRILSILTFDRN